MTKVAVSVSPVAVQGASGGSIVTPPPPPDPETFYLLTEGGDTLTDEAGNRLVWRLT